ncbi:hypothetical protein [Crocosphaera watsonii]|uniref:Uncharacterized protein n=2 Tax=Crocosphaera watsonii TaxID=263511 RepID=G5JEU4_CROWT|nr:hypothetical protein [Crocosphaera watsonii]EHJ09293.1 hypothetical protein CWATWH0003_B281 [Crocosphaera watsonii WH 0003]MCH2231773.1 hypothetical protein [Crocinitomicaceae bacterium]CCQ54725.1 hypothetical protein CWATWH0005_3373 [Crocosphaera watsonii WH 0005]
MFTQSFQEQLEQAKKLPPLPEDYQFQTLEFFDQHGVIFGLINGEYVEEHSRSHDYEPWYLGVFLDGDLAFCAVGSQIVLNRLENMVALQQLFNGQLTMDNG